ncbi:MAG: hypothetical protein KKE44_06180 [Proteobacteria bacterium]|nr:hypothetical protein [Pseudomonadota bacterium]MBU1582316.1 hypothetical protein [Pseudomonadota bacterium]MBU2452240.1 hypothetical protein [Pseudomonadota bacterium]MBU2628823.1 hypothetical protein [Pseudomonadota bacterium]
MNSWKEYCLTEFLELNPKVETKANQKYSFVEMPDLDPGQKYIYTSRKRKPNGLTKFQNGDTFFAKITPCLDTKINNLHQQNQTHERTQPDAGHCPSEPGVP